MNHEDTDGLNRAKRVLEKQQEAQRKHEEAFPMLEALAIEAAVWNEFNLIEFNKPETQRELMAMGWASVVIRQSHVTIAGSNTAMSDSVMPNLRTAFEHAVYVSLLARSDFNSAALDRLDAKLLKTVTDAVQSISISGFEELNDIESLFPPGRVPLRRPEDEWIGKMEQVCNLFSNDENLYLIYKGLSSSVHPSVQSCLPYIMDFFKSDGQQFAHAPQGVFVSVMVGTALATNVWTLSALNKILRTDYLAPHLPTMAKIAKVSVELK